jgi:tetratricopeptide (TPR) repeat protein
MWRWRLVLLILITHTSFGAPTSLGPTSEEEAATLWREGRLAMDDSRFQDAVNSLERMVARYAGKPGYLEAHLLLGEALLELGKSEMAVVPLKYYITANPNQLNSARARIALGHSYLNLNKLHEAYLVTLELDKMRTRHKLSSDILLETLLIKAQAQLGLKHESKAISALESAEKQLSEQNSPQIKGKIYGLQLQLKFSECEQLPSKGNLDEGQIRNQLDRRGTCLLEALLLFHKILKMGDLRSAGIAVNQVNHAFKSYSVSCADPPPPPLAKKRSALETRRYREELTDLLAQECQKKAADALDLLASWKPHLSAPMMVPVTQVIEPLEKLASRKP